VGAVSEVAAALHDDWTTGCCQTCGVMGMEWATRIQDCAAVSDDP